MCLNRGIFQHGRVLNPGQHKVSKLTRLAVEGAGVPAQASVQQGERDDLTLALAVFDRLVLDTHRALVTDGPGDAGQRAEIGLPQLVGNVAGDAGAGADRFSIPKAFSQPRQDSLGRKVKQRRERSSNDVCLGAPVVLDICWGHLFVEPQVSGSCGCLDAEAGRHVLAADFAHKP